MPNVAMMGWDADAMVWRKVLVNAEGKLIIDPSEIFEDPPTDGEEGKAPSSNWAFDHAADESAHHARYTDAESRAAIGNLLDSTGKLLKTLQCNFKTLAYTQGISIQASGSDDAYLSFGKQTLVDALRIYCYRIGVGFVPCSIRLFNGSVYEIVATETVVDSKILTHKGDASAHHERYTDDEARAAIGDLLDSIGVMLKNLNCNFNNLLKIQWARFQYSAVDDAYIALTKEENVDSLKVFCYRIGVNYVPAYIDIYNGSAYERVAVEPVVDSKLLTHKGDASAHHTRYTDDEARAAVGYNGTKYWSCSGIHFDTLVPATDNVWKTSSGRLEPQADGLEMVASVSLPHGAVITNAIVCGNAASEVADWYLNRITLADGTVTGMASGTINTADTSIDVATVDNSLYAYYLHVNGMPAESELRGAKITYTI